MRNVVTIVFRDGTLWTLGSSAPREHLAESEQAVERAMATFGAKPK